MTYTLLFSSICKYGLTWWLRCRESACNVGDLGLIHGLGRFSWRRAWQPTPVFLAGESPWTEEPGRLQSIGSQRVRHNWSTQHSTYIYIKSGFLGGTVIKNLPANAGGMGSISGSRRSPGEGKGNPLQYSCLKIPYRERDLVGYSLLGHKRVRCDLMTQQQCILVSRLNFMFLFIRQWKLCAATWVFLLISVAKEQSTATNQLCDLRNII